MVGNSSAERNKVIIRFRDGKMLKGFTHDFTPVKDTFHVVSEQEADRGVTHKVNIDDLKAIFFVKSLEGNKDHIEKSRFAGTSHANLRGIKIRVEFYDGEVVRGTSLGYTKKRKGFFVVPVDPESNNERVYVIAQAVTDVKVGAAVVD